MALTILNHATHPELLSMEPLRGRTIAALGYGNQGRAHALNLRDSRLKVIVGNRRGTKNHARALEDGFDVLEIRDAIAAADLVIVALPDEKHGEIWRTDIAPSLGPGKVIGFLHGFSMRFGSVNPPADVGVVLVAPKGPGSLVRSLFTDGKGLPCLFAVHDEFRTSESELIGLAWATGIGCGRAGIIRTTFADEAETDLFGEQAVLCGGMLALMRTAFETLVDAGYEPELAYLECCHEMKQVADLLYARGFAGMHEAISNTAEYGAFTAADSMESAGLRDALRDVLVDIQSGDFAARFNEDSHSGNAGFEGQRAAMRNHPMEHAGRIVRGLMPWLALDSPAESDRPNDPE